MDPGDVLRTKDGRDDRDLRALFAREPAHFPDQPFVNEKLLPGTAMPFPLVVSTVRSSGGEPDSLRVNPKTDPSHAPRPKTSP